MSSVMDEPCHFYKADTVTFESRELQPRPVPPARIPWCDHPNHSPVTHARAHTVGGGTLLTCGGALKQCPLWPDRFADCRGASAGGANLGHHG